MEQLTTQPQHWKDSAIERSASITDAWEVSKIYAGRFADWILFFCMVANIIAILPGVNLLPLITNTVLGIQIVTLDIAGFGLASMAKNARRHGAKGTATAGTVTAWTLISIMMLTLLLFTLGFMVPTLKPAMDIAEKILILVRIVMIVLYGHVVHNLREVADDQPAPRVVNILQEQINTQRDQLLQIQQQHSQELEQLEQSHAHELQQLGTDYEQRLQTIITDITNVHENRTQELIEQVKAQVSEQAQERIEAMQQTIVRIAIEQVTTATAQRSISSTMITNNQQLAIQAPRPERRRMEIVTSDATQITEADSTVSTGTTAMSKDEAKALVYAMWLEEKALKVGQLEVVKNNIVTRQTVYNWITAWQNDTNGTTEQVETNEQHDESEVA